MNIPSTQRKGFIHGLPCRRTISYDKLLSFLGTVKASTRLFNSFSHCPLTQSSTFDALMVGHESHHHVCLVPSPRSCSNHSQLEQPVPNLAQLSWVLIVSQHLCTPGLVHDHCQGDFFFLSIQWGLSFFQCVGSQLPTMGRALTAPSTWAAADSREVSTSPSLLQAEQTHLP